MIVLTGAGDRDIDAILSTGKPVVVRINGAAVGGGSETVLACDLAVNRPHTYVGQVGVRVGSVARGGATQRLPITTGDKQAREMLLGDGKRRGFGDVHG